MSDARFSIDYGKRNCKCQMSKCKQQIEKGTLRIAKIVKSPFSEDGEMKQFHHPECLFDAFKRARASTKVIDDPSDIEGWKEVKDEDKAVVIKLIRELDEFRGASKTPSKKTPPSGKKTKQTTLGNATPQKTLDDNQPLDEGSLRKYDLKGSKKDNSFREFRRLVAKVAEEPGHLATTEIFRQFFSKGSGGSNRFEGDLLVWVRLLLPGIIKRVYNLQSRQLVKTFSRVFATSEKEMLTHLEQGDVADTIATYFDQSNSKIKASTKSKLSLHDVDDFLEGLSGLTKEAEQTSALGGFSVHCTSNDLKMVIRLIKGDLRMGSGAKPVLEALHKDAYEAFNASRNVEAVVKQVLVLREELGRCDIDSRPLEVGATIMQPIQPMLAAPCKSVEMAFAKCKNGIYSEIKYDGERVQLHKKGDQIAYYSRSLKPVMPHKIKHFKDHLGKAFPQADELILDAEVLMIDNKTGVPLPFGTLGVHKAAGYADAQPCLFIFDCIYYNGKSYMSKPLWERRKLLESHMTEVGNSIKFSELKKIGSPAELKKMISSAISQGLEGLVLKDRKSTYDPGKRHWLKVKKDYLDDGAMADTADLVVLGAWYGTGNRGGIMSIFLMGCYDAHSRQWKTVTKVHSGFDDATLDKHQADLGPKMTKIKGDFSKVPLWLDCTRQMVPDFVVKDPTDMPVWEVTGAEFTKAEIHTADGISIRFPRVTRQRTDKDWETSTSLAQLNDLFKASKEVNTMTTDQDHEDDKSGESTAVTPVKNTPPPAPTARKRPSKSPSSETPKKPKVISESLSKEGQKGESDINRHNPPNGNIVEMPSPASARSYDKRYIKTEKGFVVRVEDARDTAGDAAKFVCKDKISVGEVVSKKGSYRLVVKSEKEEEFATYESVRLCLVCLRETMKLDGVSCLKLLVDVNKEPLIGLNVNAVRTLLKNVFFSESGMTITMLCPGIGPPPPTTPSQPKQSSKSPRITVKSNKVEYPFLKVFEGQPLTKIKKKF